MCVGDGGCNIAAGVIQGLNAPHGAFFRRFKIRFIVQESSIYQRVEESLLYQSPLSVNSAKFSFCRNTTEILSVTTVGISSEKNKTTVKLRLFFVKVNSMLLWDSKNNNFRL